MTIAFPYKSKRKASGNVPKFLLMFLFVMVAAYPFVTRGNAADVLPIQTPEIANSVKSDESPPMRDIPFLPPQAGFRVIPLLPVPHLPVVSPLDPVIQTSTGPLVSTILPSNFDGVGNGFTGPQGSFTVQSIPPDTNGAVGATQYVQWVNTSFAVFDKATGSAVYGPAPGNTLWSGFGGLCETNNSGDPIAQYDKGAGRWVMLQPVFKSPYAICVAVSTTSDATGSYYRYQFSVPSGYFPDYPKLGVWADGYYLSYNQFKGNRFAGAAACALDRTKMLIGNAATMQCFKTGSGYASLLPSDLDGSTVPPQGSPAYFLNFGSNSLNLWKFQVDFTTPGNSRFNGPVSIPVASFSEACGGGACIPQSGTTQKLDSLGDRLMYRLAYRNFGTYESMVVNHSVNTGNGNTGVRWYEIHSPGGTPTVYQQGTYAPDSHYRWMGSIAMDQTGNIALGYSVSSSTMNPSIRFTGRIPSDVLGTMGTEQTILNGTGSQTNYTRWGDYSSLTIDPIDDCTFWYTTEYLQSTGFNWSTRIASFKFTSCSSTITAPAAPGNLVATAGNAQVTLTWTASSGATSYTVLRSTVSGGPYNAIAAGVTTTSYNDSGLGNGTYYYVVQALNSAGTSPNSNQASATVCSTPAAPSGLSAAAGNAQVTLAWTASSGATTYNVKRSTVSGGPYSIIASGVTTTSYIDTAGLTNGTTYYYVVSAVNSCGESGNSAQVTATPQSAPATYALTVSPTSTVRGGTVTVSFSNASTPTPTDWIGLYAQGTADTAYLSWFYDSSCTQTPGTAKASGSCQYTVPVNLPAGTYEFRLFANDGFTRLTVSNALTVN